MEQSVLILLLFGSLVVIFGLGSLIGHLFGLDKYLDGLDEKRHKYLDDLDEKRHNKI